MKTLTLYSTGCPQCKVLKAKLEAANVDFVEVTDLSVLAAKQIMYVPTIEDEEGRLIGFSEAIKLLKEGGLNAN